jgi:hypothetical protein
MQSPLEVGLYTSFCKPPGRTLIFELKINGVTEKIINHRGTSPQLGLLIQDTASLPQTGDTVSLKEGSVW